MIYFIFLFNCTELNNLRVKDSFINNITLSHKEVQRQLQIYEAKLKELASNDPYIVEERNSILFRVQSLNKYDSDKKELYDNFDNRTNSLDENSKNALKISLKHYFIS